MTLPRIVRWNWTTPIATLCIALLLSAQPAVAAEKWSATRTTVPETVEELKALQDAVKKVVEKCTPCTVGLIIAGLDGKASAGSGVIVNEDGLIMTVGHVINYKPGTTCKVIFHDGTDVKGKTLGCNKDLDTGMVKITEKPPEGEKWPSLSIGKSASLKKGQWVVTLGHPGGYKPGRPPVVRLGQVLDVDLDTHVVRTTCTLVGGDSGGPLFDLNGNVVGIHDRIGFTLSSNIHLPIETYENQWDRLVKGEAITKATPKSYGAYLGVTFADQTSNGVELEGVEADGPASKAGLRSGDIITDFDGVSVGSADDIRTILRKKKPGVDVDVTIKRGTKTLEKTITLGKRP